MPWCWKGAGKRPPRVRPLLYLFAGCSIWRRTLQSLRFVCSSAERAPKLVLSHDSYNSNGRAAAGARLNAWFG